jgi:hypothetical protein
MKRMTALCWLALVPVTAFGQLPENFSYGKYLTPVEDQLRQGPCETFAAVGGVEAFYNLSYAGSNTANFINLSEREVYSCNGAPTKGVDRAFDYIRDHGVIPRSCYAMPPMQCNEQLGDPGSTNVIYEGNRNCPAEQINCSLKYRIKANPLQLTTQMTSNDGIKQALLEYGPIALGLEDGGAIHSANHGYLLYGWENQNGTTFWLLRDSWPCAAGNIRNSINLAAIFSDPATPHMAYVATSVSKENWNGSAWQAETGTVQTFELEQGRQSAVIAPPANACMKQGQYSIATSLPAGSSITGWSVRTSNYNYSNDVQISASGVLTGNAADVTVVATLQRANGLRETITLPVGDVGIPHMVETNSYCPYPNQREIDLRLISRALSGYSYTSALNLPASPDGSYYTIGNGSWYVHLVARRTQAINYSSTVTATQNGNPSCARSVTVNRYVVAMPCSYGY